MNKFTRILATLGLALVGASSVQATITTSVSFNSTTGIGGITSWPNPYTVSSVTNGNPSGFNSAENNYGGSSLFSLGQSWTATVAGNLTDVQITISGTAPVGFNVNLFDAGTSGWADIGSGTYAPGGNVSANLFSDTSLQVWSGFTLSGATAAVLDFSLTGADQVSIVSGHQYIFEISSTTNISNLIWFRMANNALDYPDGQAFRQRSPLNGNPLRDMAIAVNVAAVPEPSSLAFIAIGGMVLLSQIRPRRKA